jgi:hypothetical protein
MATTELVKVFDGCGGNHAMGLCRSTRLSRNDPPGHALRKRRKGNPQKKKKKKKNRKMKLRFRSDDGISLIVYARYR